MVQYLDNGVVLSDIVNEDAKSQKAKYFYKKAEHGLLLYFPD